MKIDGRAIAERILDNLSKKVGKLREKGVTPHVAVILLGDNESSKSYVRQKELKTAQIGAVITIHRFLATITQEELLLFIETLNNDPFVHGIIIQRPLPPSIDKDAITNAITKEKDIDGFRKDSPFDPPVALAVWRILRDVHVLADTMSLPFDEWLKKQKIVIVGKGQTAGRPIINFFMKHEIPLTIIDSTTRNREEILTNADIIISAVGKPNVITKDIIKKGVILIGVGMYRGKDGKMHGDYEEEDIKDKASYYTPVPGGVGPVNVAKLLSNLLLASQP